MALLISIIVLCALIFPFYVLAQLSDLHREVKSLKQQMGMSPITRETGPSQRPSIYGDAYEVAKSQLQATTPQVSPQPATPISYSPQPMNVTETDPITSWFMEDTFMKVGALLILIAAGWFVSYAFINDWISPVGRIALGLGVGTALMMGGVWRCRSMVDQGAIFTALGMSINLLTIYAARYIYDFFTPGLALLIMFAVVVATALISIRFKVTALAVVALLAGAMAPILAHTANPDVLGLHTYLGVLFAGALFVAAVLGAPILVLLSFGISVVYGLPYIETGGLEEHVARLAAFVFAIGFFVFSTAALLRTKSANYYTYLVTTGAIGLYVMLWITVSVTSALQGVVALMWAGGFLFAGALLWQSLTNKIPAYVQIALAIAFLALATAYYLDGTLLLVAYVMQVTALVGAALWGLRDLALARNLSWLYVGVVMMSLPHFIATSWNTGIWHSDFAVLLLIGTVLFGVGHQLASRGDDTNTDLTLISVGALYYLALIWLCFHTLFGDQLGTAVSLVTYTVIGLGLYIGGIKTSDEYARLFGAMIVGGVVVRLMLIDIWELELIFRIIAFFVIGVLLLGTAFIKKQR